MIVSDKVIHSDVPVLVDFWANWCHPCRLIAPILEEVAEQYKGKLIIEKVDINEQSDIAMEYGVMSIPTLILFEKGMPTARLVGFINKEQLIKDISDFNL